MLKLIAAFLILAQADKKLEFEVASIKPAAPDARGMYINFSPGGRVTVTNMSLKEMMVLTYRIQPFQISGGPPWFDSIRYDINAKPEGEPKQSELPLMLQSLLAERFQLVFHRETKEMSIYALVLARRDGKLGPKLVETKEGSCTAFDPKNPPSGPRSPNTMYCGNQMMGRGNLRATSIPVANLVPMLSRMLGRTVIDQTGLTGKYDINVEWTPDEGQFASFPPDGPRPPPSDATGPTIFTALQEQLGLKLESQKGPVEMFVVDKAEKPTEN